MNTDALIQLVGQIGLAGVFVFLYFDERKRNREALVVKDDKLSDMTQMALDVYKEYASLANVITIALNNNTNALGAMKDMLEKR